MKIITSPAEMQEISLALKPDYKIGFVPTMGCLHDGHLKLVEEAKKYAQKTIVSIFVNPLQFGPNEDFERYPRPFEDDKKRCGQAGVDFLFHPNVADFYQNDFATKVSVVGTLPQHLCGASRPGHFAGVTTVCMKLFQMTQPDVVVFGQKDFQQMRIIEQMIADLNLPIRLVRNPTVREADGLAMSSRNRYLSFEERERAGFVPKSLRAARDFLQQSREATVGEALQQSKAVLEHANLLIDYIAIASERDLVPASDDTKVKDLNTPRIFTAVKLGKTRLIDNMILSTEKGETV